MTTNLLRHVTVYSDHKPLEAILKKPLAQAPRRLQGMIMRFQKYDLEVRYENGTEISYLGHTFQAQSTITGADFEHVNMVSRFELC